MTTTRSTLAAITARRGATQHRCSATLPAKVSAAAMTSSRNHDQWSRRAGVMPSSATEILRQPAKSSDTPWLGLGGRRPIITCGSVSYAHCRCFSSTASGAADESSACRHDRPPVTSFSQDELMVRDLCRQWGDEVLRPVVRDMDEEGRTYPEIIQGLFECGLMGMVRRYLC